MTIVNIKGVSIPHLLAELVNSTEPKEMGYLDPLMARPMTVDEARAEWVDDCAHARAKGPWAVPHWDYVRGRCLKLEIPPDLDIDVTRFEQHNGVGLFQRCVTAAKFAALKDTGGGVA